MRHMPAGCVCVVVRVVNARLGFVRLHSFVPAVFAGNAVSTVKLTGSVVRNTKHVVHTQTDKHRCAHTHTQVNKHAATLVSRSRQKDDEIPIPPVLTASADDNE